MDNTIIFTNPNIEDHFDIFDNHKIINHSIILNSSIKNSIRIFFVSLTFYFKINLLTF
jgi:hypothetical protein